MIMARLNAQVNSILYYLVCNYRCQICANTETYCLACSPSSLRYLIVSKGLCLCPSKYYDDGVNVVC